MLRFEATECGSNIRSGSVLCGASNARDKKAEWHSLIFSRSVDDDDVDDRGPYFELDDQSQGFYQGATKVVLEGAVLRISIKPPPAQQFGHRTIEVDLSRCPSRQVEKLKTGLRLVFRDRLRQLRLA